MTFVLSLEVDDFLGLIARAEQERERAKAWDMWVSLYPRMNKKTFVPFSEFFKRQLDPGLVRRQHRPAAEVLKEAENIRNKVRARREVTARGDL